MCKIKHNSVLTRSGVGGIKASSKEILSNSNYKTKDCSYHSKTFGFFCSVIHISVPPRKQMFIWKSSKVMVCDWWISIHFVCFYVSLGLLLSLGKSSTSLLQRFFLIFFIFVTCKNKAMSTSFPRQKFH